MTAKHSSVDLLYGLEAIGEATGLGARQVQHLHERGRLPTFNMGRTICARRSSLARQFAQQETAAAAQTKSNRQRRPGRAPGRPASVIVGAAGIADRLGIDVDELTRLDLARKVPTYVASGQLCALATELDIYIEGTR